MNARIGKWDAISFVYTTNENEQKLDQMQNCELQALRPPLVEMLLIVIRVHWK